MDELSGVEERRAMADPVEDLQELLPVKSAAFLGRLLRETVVVLLQTARVVPLADEEDFLFIVMDTPCDDAR